MRVAAIISHPVHYYVPIFKRLAKEIELKVFYTAGMEPVCDPGFGHTLAWSPNLLEGYTFEFLINTGTKRKAISFMRIKNPEAIVRIETFKPDHLLVYGWAYYSHLCILRHFKGQLRITFRGDSNLLGKHFLSVQLRLWFMKWVYRHIDQALYVGFNNRLYFEKYGLKSNQLCFAPHAVDNDNFSLKRANIRKHLGISEEIVVILFTGKFNSNKNPMLLLETFLDISPSNAALLFVGSGQLEKHLKARASEYSSLGIYFLPFQDPTEMPAVYQACDLFCMPSKHETWGLAVNEAMAAGKAVIVSDHVGCATDLINESNGLIFKRNDKDDLTTKLKLLISDKALLAKKGNASKAIISAWNFDIQTNLILNAFG